MDTPIVDDTGFHEARTLSQYRVHTSIWEQEVRSSLLGPIDLTVVDCLTANRVAHYSMTCDDESRFVPAHSRHSPGFLVPGNGCPHSDLDFSSHYRPEM